MPGPTYGKSAKTVKRMRQAKPRGSFRPDSAPESIPPQSADRKESKFERDMKYLSTLPQFDDPARAQRQTEKFIKELIQRYGGKVSVGEVKANSSEPANHDAAGIYMPYDDGQIHLGASPGYVSWNMGAMKPEGIRLTPEQKKNLSAEGRRFVKNDVNSRESKRQAKQSRLIAEKILAHEFAHAQQGETNALSNPDWFIEGSAELKARKIWNDLHPNLPDPDKMYPNRVRSVKRYRRKYGKQASPYRRSNKVLGVPLTRDMAMNYLLDSKILPNLPEVIGAPLSSGVRRLYSWVD